MENLWLIALWVLLGIAGVYVWFLPYFVAKGRGHPNAYAVGLLAFFGGVTGLLWILALVWANSGPDRSKEKVRAIRYVDEFDVRPDDPLADMKARQSSDMGQRMKKRFKVRGVDEETGFETSVIVEAEDFDAAKYEGIKRGMREVAGVERA